MTVILGLESSCDDSAAALVTSDRRILSQAVVGQTAAHQPYGGVVPEIAARAHVEILPGLIRRVLDDAKLSRRRRRRRRRDRRAGPDRRRDGRFARRQGTGAGGGQAADRGQSPRRPCAVARAWPIPTSTFPYLLLLVSGGHCQLLEVRGVGDYRRLATTIDDAAGEAFDKAAKLLGLDYPGGPAIEAAGADRRSQGRPIAAPAGRLAPNRISRSRASRARCSARSPRASTSREDIAASFQQAVVDCLVDRTRARAGSERCAGAGRRRRGRRQPGDPRRAGRSRRARTAARSASRPAWLCTDNAAMIAWAGAERLRGGPDRSARRTGARALAARRRRRKGPRRGGEGMKHRRSDRRRRVGHRAGAGRRGRRPRDPAVGARNRSRRSDQRAPRKRGLPARHAARRRRSARPRLWPTSRRAMPGWWSPRPSTCARCSSGCRDCDKPLILCAKGIEEKSGALLHDVAREVCPDAADRGAVRADLRARGRGGPADRGHARRRGSGAGRAAARAHRAPDLPHLL